LARPKSAIGDLALCRPGEQHVGGLDVAVNEAAGTIRARGVGVVQPSRTDADADPREVVAPEDLPEDARRLTDLRITAVTRSPRLFQRPWRRWSTAIPDHASGVRAGRT
jgi:hypothetical protein